MSADDLKDVVQVVITRSSDWQYHVTFQGRGEVLGEMTGDELAVAAVVSGAIKEMSETPTV